MHLCATSGIMRLPESVEHHFAKWITVIFGRLLNKFGSDVTLWLQYIEYLKKTRNAATLNRVFAQYGRTLLCFACVVGGGADSTTTVQGHPTPPDRRGIVDRGRRLRV